MTRRLHILVVEDDDDSRDLMGEVLSLSGHHDLAFAKDGEEALERLREDHPYDLIVTDIGLPGINGLEMVDTAVSEGLIEARRVVVCSAFAGYQPQIIARGARSIPKPVDFAELCSAVHALSPRDLEAH